MRQLKDLFGLYDTDNSGSINKVRAIQVQLDFALIWSDFKALYQK